jgi:hypothetical protein
VKKGMVVSVIWAATIKAEEADVESERRVDAVEALRAVFAVH